MPEDGVEMMLEALSDIYKHNKGDKDQVFIPLKREAWKDVGKFNIEDHILVVKR